MEENSITVSILREIREELRATRKEFTERQDQTNARLDQTNARLDQTNARLDRAIHEQIRQGTTLVEMGRVQERLVDAVVAIDRRQVTVERAVGQMVTELQEVNTRLDNVLAGSLGRYVRDHEDRLGELEHRVEAIERKVG